MEAEIERINEYVLSISHDTHYWMIRTMGGKYYQEFIENHFIAIGYDNITLDDISNVDENDNVTVNALRQQIIELYPDISRPGHVLSQLLRFCKQIHTGDIVILPGYSSHEVTICRITGAVYEHEEEDIIERECPFHKRIPMEIIRTTNRLALPPKAQLMFGSRHPISNIDDYATYIDSSIMDYYEKGDETHIILKIDTDEDVPATDFFNLYKIMKLAEGFCAENNIDGTADDAIMKVQMESKGMLHLISSKKTLLAFIALGIMFVNGGGLNIHYGDFNLDLSTQGVFHSYSEYLEREMDRDMKASIKKSLDTLQIKTPEDFQNAAINLYEAQNRNRNRY